LMRGVASPIRFGERATTLMRQTREDTRGWYGIGNPARAGARTRGPDRMDAVRLA